jgi:hypothetical protein
MMGGRLTPWGLISASTVADIIGMDRNAMMARIKRGWPPEEAFNTPPFGKRGVQFIMPTDVYQERCRHHCP